jgi:transcriptional repressor NrdR
MNCPFCGTPDTRVVNSRPSASGDSVRRRRECQNCNKRFTTFEYIEKVELIVVKRQTDKREPAKREPFELKKLRAGIERACEKRPIPADHIDAMIREIERTLLGRTEREIPAEEIGLLVLKHLKELDVVAYIRFASVYKEFRDLQAFSREIDSLLKD